MIELIIEGMRVREGESWVRDWGEKVSEGESNLTVSK